MKFQSGFVILVIITFVLFESCSTSSTNPPVLSAIDSTLVRSARSAQRSNGDVLMTIQNRLADPRMVEKAKAWQPKAFFIDSVTRSLVGFADSLITVLRNDSKRGNGKSMMTNLIDRNVAELNSKLQRFKQQLIAVHVRIGEASFPYTGTVVTNSKTDMSLKNLFENATQQEAISILLSLQNDLLRVENWALLICLDQTTILTDDFFTSFEAIVGQNSKILKTGDSLEITAGVGSFSRTAMPKILVDGKEVNLNERGYVVYRFKTEKRFGRYTVPVTIEFTDEDGRRQRRTFNVEYRLVKG